MDPQAEDAWRRFVHLYTPLIYRWCRKQGLPPSDVADVTQEVIQAVLLDITRLHERESPFRFRSWLWGIVRHKIADHFRRVCQEVPATEFVATTEQEPPAEIGDDFDTEAFLLHRALDSIRDEFEPRTWQAFWRTTVGDERAADIAGELEMTKKAVRQAKYRVLRRLRLELSEPVDELP